MNAPGKMIFGGLLLVALTAASSRSHSAGPANANTANRIRFHVSAVAETAGTTSTIADSTIEGAPGTDFVIDLQSGRFKMNARFLTDLASPDSLRVRAKLNTRRFYGYSERNLPLYEEDIQNQELQLSFDEAIVLLPFGSGGGDELLKILITPAMTDHPVHLASGKLRPLEINIAEESPSVIGIRASLVPHNFEVEASLLADGREIATGTTKCMIEESREILLQPNGQLDGDAAQHPLAVRATVEKFEQRRSSDDATISFDAFSIEQGGVLRKPVALNWAGVAAIGSPVSYELKDYLKTSGREYELRLKVKVAEASRAY